MKQLLLTILLTATSNIAFSQPRYVKQQLVREQLDRGVVAVKTANGRIAVSWRVLESDRKNEAFDIYRSPANGGNPEKLNDRPLTSVGTFFIDEKPLATDAIYEVRGGGSTGSFLLKADTPAGCLTIPLQKPDGGQVPVMAQGRNQRQPRQRRGGFPGDFRGFRDDGTYTYSANDASVGDVDGDGQYEIFLKWEPSNAHDNAHDGYTGPVLIDCYRLDGTLLWRVNLGRNIRAGAHYTQFMVYDFDGDGRAELMCRTADGTRDGEGRAIGDSVADFRNSAGRIFGEQEYVTVFDGMTGRALDSKPYIPARNSSYWGDDKGNRSDRFLAAVGYLGNKRADDGMGLASAVFCRGYYTRTVIAAWDWDGHELKNRWTFDTNTPEWKSYAGQGNHNLRVADVDGDGLDEITYGSMAVDNDGRGLYNTGFGHGDALHLIAHHKTGELYVWDCHENRRDGSDLRNARTGEVVFQIKSRTDVGRAMAADIDPTNPGVEMWSTDSHGIRTMTGDVLFSAKDADDPQHDNSLVIDGRWLSVNFGIWWDGDLLRELLDRETVSKYDWQKKSVVDVERFEGIRFNNGTKSNPCLQADMLGDWREEVLVRNPESTELRLYVTTIPTDYRIDCLRQDIPYRLSVATENVGYNQPPEPGFYLGPDRTDYLK